MEPSHEVKDYRELLHKLVDKTGLDANTIIGLSLIEWSRKHVNEKDL